MNLPPEIAWIYASASGASLVFMAWDKFQAVRGGRRVPERWLHALEFAGGWPGAFLAMAVLRHKRSKPAFWVVTLAAELLHLCLWGLWAARLAAAH